GHGGLAVRPVGDGGGRDLDDVGELLHDDGGGGGRSGVEAGRVAGDVDYDREGGHVVALGADEADRSHRAVDGGGVARGRDVDLVAHCDLADFSVIDRRVDDVGIRAN